MRFGLFGSAQAKRGGPDVDSGQGFKDYVDYNVEAEALGYQASFVVEHHFTGFGQVSASMNLLTWVAAKTSTLRVGTAVMVLPWHNPVRVAEDVNMLDALLGPGREIICGVGRGLGRREYNGMGIDQADARDLFDESLQILRQLLATGQCSFEGKHYQIKDVHLRPQPEGDLSRNLYCAGGTAETVQIIAKHDVKPLIIPTTSLENALQNARSYMHLRGKAGFAPSDTKLALWTYCAETESEARAGAEQYMVEYADSALRHYELLRGHLGGIRGYEAYGAMTDALNKDVEIFRKAFVREHPWGTPDQVIAKVKHLANLFGTSEIMFIFRYGGMPMKGAEKSMKLFAREVLPALKELHPRPMLAEAA